MNTKEELNSKDIQQIKQQNDFNEEIIKKNKYLNSDLYWHRRRMDLNAPVWQTHIPVLFYSLSSCLFYIEEIK